MPLAAINAATFVLLKAAAACLVLQPKVVRAQLCTGLGGWVVSIVGDLTVCGLPTEMGAEGE